MFYSDYHGGNLEQDATYYIHIVLKTPVIGCWRPDHMYSIHTVLGSLEGPWGPDHTYPTHILY